jgi:predicted nucleic acid-binding protein
VIVVDASALVEVLLHTPVAASIARRIFVPGQTLHAPHLVDIEITQALRRSVLAGHLSDTRARMALTDLDAIAMRRYPHDSLLSRVWALRNNLSAYDGVYVALAEALAAPLITRDVRLAGAAGHGARIELV